MKLVKYAQSTFVVENNDGQRILLDPGKYNFERDFKPLDFGKIDLQIITHKHADHFDLDAVKELSRSYGCATITNTELAPIVRAEGVELLTVQAGDTLELAGFKLNFVRADHVVRDEHITNFGIVFEADGKRIYHTSDTVFMDIDLLPKSLVMNPDVLCVPISNRGVVMGIDDALYFTNELRPKVVIPMHYDGPKDKARVRPQYFVNTFGLLKSSLPNLQSVQVQIMEFGEHFLLD